MNNTNNSIDFVNLNNNISDCININDEELLNALKGELNRQQNSIELIASENFVSQTVLDVQGSVLTNKYAEGYSGKRYYG